MTKTRLFIIICFTFLLIIPISAKAFAVKTGDSIYIAKNQTIEGNLYAAGTSITVDGTVTGDVICAGQTVNINGMVDGDVICAGQSVNINGVVNGNVRAVGNSININGQVARNVMAFGATVNLGTEARVGWDMLIGAAIGEIRGKIGRDLHGGASAVTIAGEIGKDVRLKIDNQKSDKSGLIIMDGANIGGNIIYTDRAEALIASGAVIAGEITRNSPKIRKEKIITVWAWGRLYSIFSALVVGLVLISLWNKQIKKLTDKMLDKAGPSIGWGVIIMFLTPIIAILLLITLIGMPLAFILIGVWLIALFISKILVGILAGRNLLEKLWPKQKDSLIFAMIIGIVITWIIFSLPIIGWLFCLGAMWWGSGGIWLYFKKD
ncbi:MAG: polymer-forming cytoskeletal protein [Patescibacteria group bacterium]|nr:polymer-forming cytoskeletal protein [Patescibacteria group bacterium]